MKEGNFYKHYKPFISFTWSKIDKILNEILNGFETNEIEILVWEVHSCFLETQNFDLEIRS